MKTYGQIFTLIFCLSTSIGFSQTEKGSLLLGGDASISFEIEPVSGLNINLNPNLGIFIADRLALGANLTTGFNFRSGVQVYTIGIVPSVRYYFGISDKFDVFIRGGFGPVMFMANINGNGFEETRTIFSLTTGPSFVLFLNEHTGLHVGLNYSGFLGSETITSTQAVTLNAGLQIYLPKSNRN